MIVKNLISLTIGAVFALILDSSFHFLLKIIKKISHIWAIYRYDHYLEKDKNDKDNDPMILSIYHIVGDYGNWKDKIKIKVSKSKKFHIGTSSILRSQITDNTEWSNKDLSEYLSEKPYPDRAASAVNMDVTKFEEELQNSVKRVENVFLEKVRAGNPFFIGEMYGIHEMSLRDGTFLISGFVSDYYTHKVMADLYERRYKEDCSSVVPKIRNSLFKNNRNDKLDDLNRYTYFLTSLGMDILIYLEDEDVILMLKRSEKVIGNNKPRWHMSVNEAVSITDLVNISDGKIISFEKCVKRGIVEELGLLVDGSNSQYSISMQMVLGDVFFLKKPLEVGISAFVKLTGVSVDMIKVCYSAAKDGGFETSMMTSIPCNKRDIMSFLEESKRTKDITPAGEYLLRMFLARGNKELFDE